MRKEYKGIGNYKRTNWVLEKWYEKTAFVIGAFVSIFWVISFFIGFFSAL